MEGNIDKAFLEKDNNERLLKRSLIDTLHLFENIENFGGKINKVFLGKLENSSQKINQLTNEYPEHSDKLKEINNQVNLLLENKDYLEIEKDTTPGKNIEEFKLIKEKSHQFKEVAIKIKSLLEELYLLDSKEKNLEKNVA